MEEKSSLYIVAIVGVVAVVAMVIMVMNVGVRKEKMEIIPQNIPQEMIGTGENVPMQDAVGQAFSLYGHKCNSGADCKPGSYCGHVQRYILMGTVDVCLSMYN
jgi:hypothetical protein